MSLNTGIQTQTHRPLSAVLFTESTAREGMAKANKGKGEGQLNIYFECLTAVIDVLIDVQYCSFANNSLND